MNLGFDAKRAFNNYSGLGNYCRNLLQNLMHHFPENKYFLYTPKIKSNVFNYVPENCIINVPNSFTGKKFPTFWRTYSITKLAKKNRLDIYHGLSHELPMGIENSGIKTVVTIHDLIFLRYPDLFNSIDRFIYKKKFKRACLIADKIVAISQQTANDIQEYFKIPEFKIEVIYQGCNEIFKKELSFEEKEKIRNKYKLPSSYILYVGNIEERKNLFSVIRALHEQKLDMPLVAIGRKTSYFKKIREYLNKHQILHHIFIETVHNNELPGFYQLAEIFIYPSIFEGFGIPIIEALYSKTPVITTKGGVFPESGGQSSVYVDPFNIQEMGEMIKKVLGDEIFKKNIIEDGYQYAQKFDNKRIAEKYMNLYNKILA